MDIQEVSSDQDREHAVTILKQLWTSSDSSEMMEWTDEDDYTLFGGYVDGKLVAVAGVMIGDFLHHTSHCWIYDLVVDESYRGNGYGEHLIRFVEEWAKSNDCDIVSLASPSEKEEVHRYYEQFGFQKWGYIIEKEL